MIEHKRKAVTLTSILLFIASFILGSAAPGNHTARQVYNYYAENLDSLKATVLDMQQMFTAIDQSSLQVKFKRARHFYKKIEFLTEYHFSESAGRLNAPNLPEAKISSPDERLYPTGFQVLEEALFDPEVYNRSVIYAELSGISFALNRLEATFDEMELSSSNILDALKLNLYRLITKGISGFDSPVALNSLAEARSTISGTIEVLQYFPDSRPVTELALSAAGFLDTAASDFNSFDRATFIVRYINPLCDALHAYQVASGIPFAKTPPRAIPADVPNLFSEGAFDLSYFAPSYALPLNDQTLTLGKRLFFDPRLSAANTRSCASCHDPAKAFTDGLKVNESLAEGKTLLRNTPSLINAALQPVQFYDSRIAFLEDQVHDVISSPSEMGGVFSHITEKIARDKAYEKAFRQVFSDGKISERNIKSAIAAYVRSLVALNSPFDHYMRGETTAMTPLQIKGFNLFMGKAKCGTCHFMPLFTGTVPPLFEKMESEVLGVPANADTLHAIMDSDSGKYRIYHIPHHLFSFKTTTVRNTAYTAPYMHNGVYSTLEEVIDFYDRGGGAGLGFELENQTLPPDRLQLSQEEKDALIAFLKALNDTVTVKPVVQISGLN